MELGSAKILPFYTIYCLSTILQILHLLDQIPLTLNLGQTSIYLKGKHERQLKYFTDTEENKPRFLALVEKVEVFYFSFLVDVTQLFMFVFSFIDEAGEFLTAATFHQ